MDSTSDDTRPVPAVAEPRRRDSTPSPSGRSSNSSNMASDDERDVQLQHRRAERPKMGGRKPSKSMVVKADHPEIEIENEEFPPDDARAMSPRRNSDDLERLGEQARQTLKESAKTYQSSLAALAERIDEVKSDHDKLESENKFLQDYIGGLIRTSSKTDIASSSGSGKNKK